MGDLINFPTWIIEKERNLAKLELHLSIREEWIEAEAMKVEGRKSSQKAKIMLAFFAGMLFGSMMLIPLI